MILWIDTFILVLISDISLRAFYKYLDKEGDHPSLILAFISDICFFILLIVYTNFVVKYFV